MLKLIISAAIALSTSMALATSIISSQTVEMTQQEISVAIELANQFEVPLMVDGPCTSTNFEVASKVRGFNPANWTLKTQDNEYLLQGAVISELIALVNRVEARLIILDSITTEQRVYIQGSSCGFTPYTWTVTFN